MQKDTGEQVSTVLWYRYRWQGSGSDGGQEGDYLVRFFCAKLDVGSVDVAIAYSPHSHLLFDGMAHLFRIVLDCAVLEVLMDG